MPRQLNFEVPAEFEGEKLVVFLRGHIKISARLLTKLKNDPLGLLRNGEHIRTIDRLHTGDIITVKMPEEASEIPPSDTGNLDIIYEDDDILLINKTGDIAMHPTHNHQGDTLANKIAAYFCQKNRSVVFRTVGRLDKSTSGLVLVALNAHVANVLSDKIHKEYLAITEGAYTGDGTINKPIIRPDPMKTYRWVGEGGDHAVTHWKSLMTDGRRSLLRICLETGRTHQIRVHFASEGTPLAGDDMYGAVQTDIFRAALHCASLTFPHPVTGENMHFEAPLPSDMQLIASSIEKNNAEAK